MSFFRRSKEPVAEVETSVWACTSEDCKGWMRETFSFDEDPSCPLCQSSMEKEKRVLPEMSE